MYHNTFESFWLNKHDYDYDQANQNQYKKDESLEAWEAGFQSARDIVKDEIGNLHGLVDKLDAVKHE